MCFKCLFYLKTIIIKTFCLKVAAAFIVIVGLANACFLGHLSIFVLCDWESSDVWLIRTCAVSLTISSCKTLTLRAVFNVSECFCFRSIDSFTGTINTVTTNRSFFELLVSNTTIEIFKNYGLKVRLSVYKLLTWHDSTCEQQYNVINSNDCRPSD